MDHGLLAVRVHVAVAEEHVDVDHVVAPHVDPPGAPHGVAGETFDVVPRVGVVVGGDDGEGRRPHEHGRTVIDQIGEQCAAGLPSRAEVRHLQARLRFRAHPDGRHVERAAFGGDGHGEPRHECRAGDLVEQEVRQRAALGTVGRVDRGAEPPAGTPADESVEAGHVRIQGQRLDDRALRGPLRADVHLGLGQHDRVAIARGEQVTGETELHERLLQAVGAGRVDGGRATDRTGSTERGTRGGRIRALAGIWCLGDGHAVDVRLAGTGGTWGNNSANAPSVMRVRASSSTSSNSSCSTFWLWPNVPSRCG